MLKYCAEQIQLMKLKSLTFPTNAVKTQTGLVIAKVKYINLLEVIKITNLISL